jgi:hypothetical protein
MYYARLPIFKHGNQNSNMDVKYNITMYKDRILWAYGVNFRYEHLKNVRKIVWRKWPQSEVMQAGLGDWYYKNKTVNAVIKY